MTMSFDKDLYAAGFSAAEMGVGKLRQKHAKKYADKFADFADFEATFTLSSNIEDIEHKINNLWTHCVVGEKRWEVRASFSVMVAKVVLKATSTTNEATSKVAEVLALWCLRGDGDDGGVKQRRRMVTCIKNTHDTRHNGVHACTQLTHVHAHARTRTRTPTHPPTDERADSHEENNLTEQEEGMLGRTIRPLHLTTIFDLG